MYNFRNCTKSTAVYLVPLRKLYIVRSMYNFRNCTTSTAVYLVPGNSLQALSLRYYCYCCCYCWFCRADETKAYSSTSTAVHKSRSFSPRPNQEMLEKRLVIERWESHGTTVFATGMVQTTRTLFMKSAYSSIYEYTTAACLLVQQQ